MRKASEYAELQRRCAAILRDLGVHRSLSLDAIRERVEELRGRPLVLRELPEQAAVAGACGLWLGTDDADYVFYEARTAPLHREHIILHEIGHVLCDHHRGVTEGVVTGVATPVHVGRSTSTFEVALTDERGRRICTGRLTCMHLDSRPGPR